MFGSPPIFLSSLTGVGWLPVIYLLNILIATSGGLPSVDP